MCYREQRIKKELKDILRVSKKISLRVIISGASWCIDVKLSASCSGSSSVKDIDAGLEIRRWWDTSA